MSSMWISNTINLDVMNLPAMFARRGNNVLQTSFPSNVIVCQTDDDSGYAISSSALIVGTGYIYNYTLTDLADQTTDSIAQILELVGTINGDYSLFIETDSFYIAITDPWKTKHLWIAVNNKIGRAHV